MATTFLYWVIPGELAGMPMPFVHSERRLNNGGALDDYEDELPALHHAGIRAVVSLLRIPSDEKVFSSAGFSFICSPVPDGAAPSLEQMFEIAGFIERSLAQRKSVAVHCEAGLGRTGAVLAGFLITRGHDAESAIRQVRSVERSTIETARQIEFLHQLHARQRNRCGSTLSSDA